MNRLKIVISVLSAAVIIAGCFAGCAKRPEEETTTATTVCELVNKKGEVSTDADEDTPDAYVSTSSDVVFTVDSYNTYKDNYASIKNITFDNESLYARAYCYCDLDMVYVGHDSDKMIIAYKAYDSQGNVIRDTYLQADVSKVKSGETVTGVRFDIPYDTVKVVFSDFTGGQNEES